MDADHQPPADTEAATPHKAAGDADAQPASAANTPAAASAAAVGSGGKRKAGSYTTSHPHDTAAAGKELLDKLSFYINQLGGALGDGWKCNVTMVTVADNGETGTCNAAYIGPNGKRYRTRAEVAKFLGLDVPTGKGARMSGHGTAAAAAAGKAHDDAAAGGSPTAAAGDDDQHVFEGTGISKAEAYAAAVERAAQLKADGMQLPLRLKQGVVVEQLGSVDLRPTFSTPLSILPPGYRAVFEDPAVGKFVSEIKAPPGAKHPQFVVSLEVSQQQLQQLETASSTGRTYVPGLELSGQQQQPAAACNGGDSSNSNKGKTYELVAARSADIAWAQVGSLQERAKLQVEAAAAAAAGGSGQLPANPPAAAAAGDAAAGPHTDEAIDLVLAQLLAKAGNLKGCWGKAMFGLSEVEVLQLIEALPDADKTSSYQFVDERGGWAKEREFLAKGRWAKRSAMQVGVKKTPTKQQQAAAGGKAADTAAGKKRPHPAAAAAAAAAATAGSNSTLFGPAANKRYRAMDREDRQIAGAVDKVLDKMINKVEIWWVNETVREAKKAEKAEARQAANEARKAARAAKEAADKESGTPDKQQQPHQRSLPPAAAPLQEDLLLPGASSSIAPAAAAALRILRGHQAQQLLQIWEFACCFGPLLGLEQVPSLQQLELGVLGLVSHTGTMGSSMLGQVHVPGSRNQQQQQQGDEQQDAGDTPAAAAAALGVSQQQIESEAAAGNSWVQLHTTVLSILIEDAFSAVSTATFDTQHMKAAQLKELRAAIPHVDITTWPEAARRYLAAAATATYLAQGEPKSSATGSNAKELDMPGHLKSMEVQDWAQYLCGGLNMPDLISRIALLPQGSSETAAESLLMLDDAAALAAAEQRVQQLSKQQQQQQNAGAMDVDGHDPTAINQQQEQEDPDQQRLLGRRLLQALVKVWGEKSKNNNGQRMCFYAQELNPKLGRARGLDLHSVAARLEKGLYAAAGEPLEALAADVILACDLWRDAFNTFDMSHEEGFRTADSRLADAVEERLQQLLQDIKNGSNLAAAAGLEVGGQGPEGQAGEAAAAAVAEPEGQVGEAAAAGFQGQAAAAAGPEGQAAAAAGPEGQARAAAGLQGQAQDIQQQPTAAGQAQGPAAAAAAADAMDVDSPSKQPASTAQPAQQSAPQAVTAAAPPTAANALAEPPAAGAAGQQQKLTADEEQQQEQQEGQEQQQQGEEQEQQQVPEHPDPHGLKDPKRSFNPLQGCRVCWREDDKARLLLCDGCEDEYHCYCVTPALLDVPEGDWYCPVCSSRDDGPTTAAAEQQPGSSSSSSWDMAACAQLPAVTGSTEPIWDRPGMQYIKELVGTAQKLAAVPYGSWPVGARLSLLVLLCEMLAASHAGRRFIDERMDQKVAAKRKMAESKARINKAKKEAAEAAKAAKAAKQKGVEGGASAAATADDTAVKEESVDPTAEAATKPAGSKAKGKGLKGKKAAAAAAAEAAAKQTRAHGPAEEPFDEETELRTIAVQQQLIELSNVRRLCLGQDRFRNTYWLLGTSQLLYADNAAAAAAGDDEAAAAAGGQHQQHGHKGHQHVHQSVNHMGTYGVVMVQPADPAAAAAAAAAVPKRSKTAAKAASILAAVLPPTVPAAAVPKGDVGPLRLLADIGSSSNSSSSRELALLPALQQQQPSAAAAAAGGDQPDDLRPWGVYTTLADIDALLAWVNPQGVREAALKAALRKVRDNMALFAPDIPTAAAAAGPGAGEGGFNGQQQNQQLQQLLEGDVKSSRAGSPFPVPAAAAAAGPAESKHPKLVLKFKQQQYKRQEEQQHQQERPSEDGNLALPAAAVGGNGQQQDTAAPADLQQQLLAAAAAADDAAAAAALRAVLERLAASIPDMSMHETWGSDNRRDLWYSALAAATTPADFAALIATLEVMVLTDSWRMGFQIWAVPAQHPGLVKTWPQVWYRFLGVDSAKRPGLPTKQQRDRAQELAWRSHARGKAAAGQQQQRKRPRVDYAALDEQDGWEDEEEDAAAAAAGSKQRQQQSLYGSRSRPAAAAGYGSGGRTTRGRQQQQEQLELFAPRSGRAAAAKAAAAITQQSKGVAAPTGRKRYDFSDDEDEFDYSEYSSEDQGENDGEDQQQQEDEDAALAAALAAESHHPRRAAAVAATEAMAAASSHPQQQQQRGRHGRLARGNGKQSARPAKKASKQQQRKGGSSKGKKGKGGSRKSNHSDSEDEDYSELSEGDDEVASELEDDISEGGEVHSEHGQDPGAADRQQEVKGGKKASISIKGSKAVPAAAAADADDGDGGQQQQQLLDESAEDRAKQQKRPAEDRAAVDVEQQQQPAAKKLKAGADTAQQQQQQQTPAVEALPGADDDTKQAAALAAAGDASKPAAAAAAKPKALAKLNIKKPQAAKSKTEALQDLLGTGAAPLTTLSGKPTAAAGPAQGGTGPAAAAAGRPKVDTAAAAADTGKQGLLSPKKMLLQRHESETLQQQQEQKQKQQKQGTGGSASASAAAGSGGFRQVPKTTSPRAAAVGHFGSSSAKARLAAEQRAKADPKVASKEKVAWSDEDDD